MTYIIKHLFHISASTEKVYKAIAGTEGLSHWWTTQTKGSEDVDGEIKFNFGEYQGPTMKIIELVPNKKIVWQCVESNGWLDHIFTFDLDENDGKTRIRFSHEGWEDQGDFYAGCCFSWGRYLESLRQYCQTGKGEGYGTPGYRQ
ncbi:SRPBCC family protein [Spongiimicrobium sp. 3-5]|uniref:SRPBCC family protein n=1 Tax=Spongiimicrobium sp. 3-5 TaxID=3332596 RepID=UPI003980B3E1